MDEFQLQMHFKIQMKKGERVEPILSPVLCLHQQQQLHNWDHQIYVHSTLVTLFFTAFVILNRRKSSNFPLAIVKVDFSRVPF